MNLRDKSRLRQGVPVGKSWIEADSALRNRISEPGHPACRASLSLVRTQRIETLRNPDTSAMSEATFTAVAIDRVQPSDP